MEEIYKVFPEDSRTLKLPYAKIDRSGSGVRIRVINDEDVYSRRMDLRGHTIRISSFEYTYWQIKVRT